MPITKSAGPAVDAYCTTGSSPGGTARNESRGLERREPPEPSNTDRLADPPTLHLIGAGAVGRALLRLLSGERFLVTGVTDSSATVRGPGGLDGPYIARVKDSSRHLRDLPGARALPLARAIAWVDADVVVDATPTDHARPGWPTILERDVLERGRSLALAAKDALCRSAAAWLHGEYGPRIGCNAVLGGTGRFLQRELSTLAGAGTALAIAGNASTTVMLETIERGGDLADGLAEARRRGFLESDPELDLRGTDAAVKLAIVAGALHGRAIDPASIACDDIRAVDAAQVRERFARGTTTRLVARAETGGELRVAYEEVPRGSPLAVPCDRVVYLYRVAGGDCRIHVGGGLGALETARALLEDVRSFRTQRQATAAGGGAR